MTHTHPIHTRPGLEKWISKITAEKYFAFAAIKCEFRGNNPDDTWHFYQLWSVNMCQPVLILAATSHFSFHWCSSVSFANKALQQWFNILVFACFVGFSFHFVIFCLMTAKGVKVVHTKSWHFTCSSPRQRATSKKCCKSINGVIKEYYTPDHIILKM